MNLEFGGQIFFEANYAFQEFGSPLAAEGKGLGQIFAGVVVDDHVAKLLDFAEICRRVDDAAFFGFLKDVEKGARFLEFKCYQGAEGFVNKSALKNPLCWEGRLEKPGISGEFLQG